MKLNKYTEQLNKIEFVITYACTGRCKHCSEGEHKLCGEHIDQIIAVKAVNEIADAYPIKTLMTFGGEPLLQPDTVCAIHQAGKDMGIPKRQVITNGFFSKDVTYINEVASRLFKCGVNDVLLSVDAFHQETIPLEYVKLFAKAALSVGLPIRTQPAWLVSRDTDNPYNEKTKEILSVFSELGISENDGNIVFPSGNALKYLKEYFDEDGSVSDPYIEDPYNVKTFSIEPDGNALEGNLYRQSALDILSEYSPKQK